MADFRHGKGVRPLIDEKDMSEFLNSFTISASMDAAETTTFKNNDKNFIRGLRDVTASFEGLFAAATASTDDVVNFLDGALGGSTRFVVTVDGEGTTGGRAFMMTGDMVTYDISAPVSDVVSLSLDVQGSGGYRGGRMLRPNVTSTSTGSQSGIITPGTTTAGGTTGGGLAHLHVTRSTNIVNAIFKVQHSTSGTTWADLITFSTVLAAKTFQRSTVAGTVKERVRSTLSQLTKTSSTIGTLTASIAFTRQGRRT